LGLKINLRIGEIGEIVEIGKIGEGWSESKCIYRVVGVNK